jgi:hypothetical protein
MHHDNAIIERLGGQAAVARLCNNAVTPQAVHHWTRRGIPPAWRLWLHSLRPDAFEFDNEADGQGVSNG